MIKISFAKILFWSCVLAILVLTMLPTVAMEIVYATDKFAHFIAFFILSFLLWSAYKLPQPFITSVFLLGGFGLVIELLQYYIPYRSFSLFDFAADVAGVVVGGVLYKLLDSVFSTA